MNKLYSDKRDVASLKRFWLQTNKKGPIHPKEGQCWEWTGYYRGKGKGVPVITYRGKQIRASRFSYMEFVGVIPEGLYVLHKCDNTACVNPAHLFVGTQVDNMKDMVSKDRANKPKGVSNGRAKLTEDDVRFIRANYKSRDKEFSQKALSIRFGVCVIQIQSILYRKQWTHLK